MQLFGGMLTSRVQSPGSIPVNQALHKPHMVIDTCSSNSGGEEGGSEIQGHLQRPME